MGWKHNEWIELYNNDTKNINITDWTVKILKATGEQVGKYNISGIVMEPGDYVILARKPGKFDETYNVTCPVLEVSWSNLPNDGGTIILNDSSATLIDSVNYTEYASANLGKNNYTLELNASGGWEESDRVGGTPCQPNSVLPPTPFVIDGYVFYADNTSCPNPSVNITNLNIEKEWSAETHPNSNHY